MKRFIYFVAAALLFFSATASARGNFGVTAGMNFNSAKIGDVRMDTKAGWNLGVAYNVSLPFGFSFQPALMYEQKSAGITVDMSSLLDGLSAGLTQVVGSVKVPVSLQWGPDLLVARPFVDLTPYVGYSVFNKLKGEVAGISADTKGKNALDYGVGIGAGLDVWKLQVIVRYNWNFGVLGSLRDFSGATLENVKFDEETFSGITVNLAFFF